MGLLDPADCMAARECLRQGNALEAARLLLRSPQRNHRAARQLLLEISTQLVEQAAGAYGAGDVLVASEMMDCAAQCAELRAEAAALRDKIARERRELEKDRDWRERRLDRARTWVDEGRVRSAIGLLRQLTDSAEAEHLRLDLEEQLARFQRYVEECRQYLERGRPAAARDRFLKARSANPADPQLIELERALRETEPPEAGGEEPTVRSRTVNDRSMSFTLADHALVVSQHEVVIGNPRGESVQIPFQARIHRRHALIVRDRGRYRLVPYTDCKVLVNGDPVAASRELKDDDLLELGNPLCRWRFRLPVAGSGTAVLEQASPASAWVQTPDGGRFRRVVLVDAAAEIRPHRPAHLVLPDLPCGLVRLRWTREGLIAEAEGGTLTMEAGGEPAGERSTILRVPGRLEIRSELTEAEWLVRIVAGQGREFPTEVSLPIRDPFAR